MPGKEKKPPKSKKSKKKKSKKKARSQSKSKKKVASPDSDSESSTESSSEGSATEQVADSPETKQKTRPKIRLSTVLGADVGRWIPECPVLDATSLKAKTQLCKLFEDGWSRGKITQSRLKNKNSNVEVQWFDEPSGDVHLQQLLKAEYYSCEVQGQEPAVGAWFFLSS
jgi:hypothetical protein